MSFINWSSNLSVSVAEIDQQHQKLVGLINELHDAMKQGKGKEVLGKIVNELINYTATHFSLEERYFAKFSYPETGIHKLEHADFVKKVTAFKNDFSNGKTILSVEVMNFLSDWLQKHIQGTDKRYTQCFNEHGLK